jgi:hypothetical protein
MAFDPVRVREVLNAFGENVIAKAQQNLDARGINASKDLRNRKMKFVAKVMPNSIDLRFFLGEYGQGIDQGVGGTSGTYADSPFKFKKNKPSSEMVDNILQWASDKGVGLTGNNSKQIRASAYNLSRYILEKGIKPTNFFSDAYEEHFSKIPNDIAEAFGLDVDRFFELVFQDKRI